MELHDAIGIDPDAFGCVACLVRRSGTKATIKSFSLTPRGRDALLKFILSIPDALVGIEGRRGQSSPLEEFFEDKGITYYSIPAVNIASYRTAMVGAQKNNRDDARAVSEFLLDLETKNRLDVFMQKDETDEELRLLARERLMIGQEMTVLANRLWKILKRCANDLYLALSGNGDDDTKKTRIASRRLLNLFVAMPELSQWSTCSEEAILQLSGGKRLQGWDNFLATVRTPIGKPVGFGHVLVIKNLAQSLLQMIDQKEQLEQALEQSVEERPAVKALRDNYVGMGTFSAALIAEEIVTIDRFKNDDHLASYAGLTKRDCSTGSGSMQRQSTSCNKRLKSAFISFAKSYLHNNKGSHIDKYHQNLLKRGMSRMEALKRIARALEREVYRFLKQHALAAATTSRVAYESGKSVA